MLRLGDRDGPVGVSLRQQPPRFIIEFMSYKVHKTGPSLIFHAFMFISPMDRPTWIYCMRQGRVLLLPLLAATAAPLDAWVRRGERRWAASCRKVHSGMIPSPPLLVRDPHLQAAVARMADNVHSFKLD